MPVDPFTVGGLVLFGGASAYFARSLTLQLKRDLRPFALRETGSGLMLGRGAKEPFVFTGQEMGVTVGSTGSGKFVAAIAPNLLSYPGSCFVIDPKGEACAVTAHARQTALKQKVHRLDPFDATQFVPADTTVERATLNPLDALDPTQDSVVSDAGSLASAIIIPTPDAKNPFWKDSARELLTALILFTLTHPDAAGKRNLSQVLAYLSSSPERWDWLHVEMERSDFAAVRHCSTALRSQGDKVFGSIVQQARSEMGFAMFPEVERAMATSSFALSDLFTDQASVYLVLPASRLESHKQWLRLMVAASLLAAGRFKRSQVATPVLWIIDEAARLGTMEDIPKAYGLMRGHGVRVWTFWQDLGQLKSCYPNDWSSLIGNSFLQVLAVGDLDSAEYVAKMAGESLVNRQSVSQGSYDLSDWELFVEKFNVRLGRPSPYAYKGRTVSTSSQWEPVIRPENILRMPSDCQLVRLPGESPVFVSKMPYFDVPGLNSRAMANPYHSQR